MPDATVSITGNAYVLTMDDSREDELRAAMGERTETEAFLLRRLDEERAKVEEFMLTNCGVRFAAAVAGLSEVYRIDRAGIEDFLMNWRERVKLRNGGE